MDNWTVKIVDEGYITTRKIYIYRKLVGGIEVLRADKTVQLVPDRCTTDEPTLLLEPEMLQAFADALNKQGYKPQGGFVEGKLEATEKHLQDMQKLVFKKK